MRVLFGAALVLAVGLPSGAAPPPPAPKSIVELAEATPSLSTLVAAIKAADLVGELSYTQPMTVFAPDNTAFDALPDGVLAHLLQPANKAELANLLRYHMALGQFPSTRFVPTGLAPPTNVTTQNTYDVFLSSPVGHVCLVNNATVTRADISATNGIVHIIDQVLTPWGKPHPLCRRDSCKFSFVNPAFSRCGEVDAAPRMPADIWADQDAVRTYVATTIELYALGLNMTGTRRYLTSGACSQRNRPRKGQIETIKWADPALMGPACKTLCHCDYPNCPDQPDRPAQGSFCSLCGPKFNAPVQIQYYYGIF